MNLTWTAFWSAVLWLAFASCRDGGCSSALPPFVALVVVQLVLVIPATAAFLALLTYVARGNRGAPVIGVTAFVANGLLWFPIVSMLE